MTTATDDIVCEQTYPHSIERVWRALTTSEGPAVWLMPNDFEPRVGHRFTFRTAPEHMWNGVVTCEVVALEEPRRVAYTWQGGELPQTLIEFTLTPVAEGTHLRLVHSGFAAGGKPALTVRGVHFVEPPTKQDWGMMQAIFTDQDGNNYVLVGQ